MSAKISLFSVKRRPSRPRAADTPDAPVRDSAPIREDAPIRDGAPVLENAPEAPRAAEPAPAPPADAGPAPKRLYLLAFALPFCLLGLAFALHRVFPFGNRQILVTDFWQQYYPLFCELRRKLVSGDSLLYSWNSGLGVNFLGMAAYYLSSPLNLLVLLVPERFLREGLTLILLVKIGAAGVCACFALRKVFGVRGYVPAFFGAMYALCAFTLGYYWNLIWFDAVALAPLVAAAAILLIRGGRPWLYLVSLSLCLIVNYYIGYGVCLYVFLLFFLVCFVRRIRGQVFVRRLVTIAAASLLAAAISAVLTLPALLALRLTYRSFSAFPAFSVSENFIKILGNFASFVPPSSKVGLPNLASSVLAFSLLIPYAACRRIPLRERIAGCGLFVFLLLSCGISTLNFVWHGFHTTNMLPYRFSYLATMTLIALAARYFTVMRGLQIRDLPFYGAGALAFLICTLAGGQGVWAAVISAVFCAAYALLLLMYRNRGSRRFASLILAALLVAELGVNAYIGVRTVQTTDRSSYPGSYAETEALLDELPEGFYRVETAARFSYNDPLLYGYRGVGLFSSTANAAVTRFVENLGLHGWDAGNRYVYAETSPLTDVFLGLKYLISFSGELHDMQNRRFVKAEQNTRLYENRFALSPAFMADAALLDYKGSSGSPFTSQNELFRAATGLKDELFTPVNPRNTAGTAYTLSMLDSTRYSFVSDGTTASGSLRWNYTVPADGIYYAWTSVDHISYIHVIEGNESWWYEQARPYIFCMGEFKAGEEISLFANIDPGYSGSARVRVCRLNEDALTRGLSVLSQSQMRFDENGSGRLSGTVSAARDGLLYLSVPADPGWRARVDGKKAVLETVDGAMLALPLTKGSHTVTLTYRPAGFAAGLVITLLALAAAVLWYLYDRRQGRRHTRAGAWRRYQRGTGRLT